MKKVLSIILAILAVVTITTISVAAANYGNTASVLITIPALSQNQQFGALKKTDANINYSSIVVHESNSTINKMDAWVMTTAGDSMSGKVRMYPDNKEYKIAYSTSNGTTFAKGSYVAFWGEQANITAKNANMTLRSY